MKMLQIHQNKKGEDMLVDFVTIFVFALILLIFLVVIMTDSKSTGINSQNDFKDKDTGLMLNSFLRAPSLDSSGKNVADIIAEDALKDDFSRTSESFSKFFIGANNYDGYTVSDISLCVFDNTRVLSTYSVVSTDKGFVLKKSFSGCVSLAGRDLPSTFHYSEAKMPKIDNGYLTIRLEIHTMEVKQEEK